MNRHDDFSARAVEHAATLPWVPSPIPGVDRRMLDRVGGELARATSIVRYAPGSAFSPHTHGGGEEFLVLDGVFQDEHGDFPVGTYVRNPPESRHAPASAPGCTIFVKLWQFAPSDRHQMRVGIEDVPHVGAAGRPGVSVARLFGNSEEEVRVEWWEPAASIAMDLPGGGEFLVLDGGFSEGGDDFVTLSWLRLPVGAVLRAKAGAAGARVWIKTGHLAHVRVPQPA